MKYAKFPTTAKKPDSTATTTTYELISAPWPSRKAASRKKDNEGSTLSQSSSEDGKRVTRGASKRAKEAGRQPVVIELQAVKGGKKGTKVAKKAEKAEKVVKKEVEVAQMKKGKERKRNKMEEEDETYQETQRAEDS